jgi:hypothetical protein
MTHLQEYVSRINVFVLPDFWQVFNNVLLNLPNKVAQVRLVIPPRHVKLRQPAVEQTSMQYMRPVHRYNLSCSSSKSCSSRFRRVHAASNL